MTIHIGKQIQKRAEKLGIGPSKLATMVDTSKQNINAIYKRPSLNSELLFRFCDALHYDFFRYYTDIDENGKLRDEEIKYDNSHLLRIRELEDLLDKQRKEIRHLKETNTLLKQIKDMQEKEIGSMKREMKGID